MAAHRPKNLQIAAVQNMQAHHPQTLHSGSLQHARPCGLPRTRRRVQQPTHHTHRRPVPTCCSTVQEQSPQAPVLDTQEQQQYSERGLKFVQGHSFYRPESAVSRWAHIHAHKDIHLHQRVSKRPREPLLCLLPSSCAFWITLITLHTGISPHWQLQSTSAGTAGCVCWT